MDNLDLFTQTAQLVIIFINITAAISRENATFRAWDDAITRVGFRF
jgi:hypothetical protein